MKRNPSSKTTTPARLTLGALLVLAATSAAAAQDFGLPTPPLLGPAAEGAEFLLIPMGARAVGMGRAVTASRGQPEATLWNPAGLAAVDGLSFSVHHEETPFTQNNVLSLAFPVSFGTLGVTYFLVDFGETERRDENNQLIGVVSARNQEFVLTFARRLVGPLEAGASYKLVQLVCNGPCTEEGELTATTHAWDVGFVLDHPGGLPLSGGLAILHAGFPLRVAAESEADPLPTRLRAGVSYDALAAFMSDSVGGLKIEADLEEDWSHLGSPDVFLGAEASYGRWFFLRAGYAWAQRGSRGGALGLGLVYTPFYFNLSRRLDDASELGGDPLQISLGLVF